MQIFHFQARIAVWLVLLGLVGGAVVYCIHMPGKSHSGPLPPLSDGQVELSERLRAHVQTLAGEVGERNVWHRAALTLSADYIEETFTGLGYAPESQAFDSRGASVRNLIAERQGHTAPREIVVVGAHYDTVPGSPGANDNGSGVAALLELARLLRHRPLARSVRFVAFVNEEGPFFGSEEMGSLRYAARSRAQGEDIMAMLSLETIGYYSDKPDSQLYPFPLGYIYPDTGNFIGFVGNLASRRLVRRALKTFRARAAFPSEGLTSPERVTGVSWSDHWSFWQQGYRAIMVTDTALFRYPYYHSSHDTPDKLDYERLARVVEGLGAVVAELAAK